MPLIPHMIDCDDSPRLSADKRRWLYMVADHAGKVVKFRHRVNLYCLGTQWLWYGGHKCEGLFWYDEAASDMWLSCMLSPEHICRTLAHELVHYEQWRDGRTMSEKEAEFREGILWEYLYLRKK